MSNKYFSRNEGTIDYWETPDYFFNLLDNLFSFTLDPCAISLNFKCRKYFNPKKNGLIQNWKGESVFVNPPFSNISNWAKKCYEEGIKENTLVVMIIPSRTDTIYWHNFIMRANEIWFCKGRVSFLKNGKKGSSGSTFPLSVIIFNSKTNCPPLIKTFFHKEIDIIKNNCNIDSFILKKGDKLA